MAKYLVHGYITYLMPWAEEVEAASEKDAEALFHARAANKAVVIEEAYCEPHAGEIADVVELDENDNPIFRSYLPTPNIRRYHLG